MPNIADPDKIKIDTAIGRSRRIQKILDCFNAQPRVRYNQRLKNDVSRDPYSLKR